MGDSFWSSITDPEVFLRAVRRDENRRKLRLFAIACGRHFEEMLMPECGALLRVAEAFADGAVGQSERREARAEAFSARWHADRKYAHRRGPAKACVTDALARQSFAAATGALFRARQILRISLNAPHSSQIVDAPILEILRDIFGKPTSVDSELVAPVNPFVAEMAQSIYERNEFNRVPELAGILQQSGCTDSALIEHCRIAGKHVRGCWAIDLLLGLT